MDDGWKPQLTEHQCDIIYQNEYRHHSVFPCPHAPMPLREAQYDAIHQEEVTDHDNPLDNPVRLIISTHESNDITYHYIKIYDGKRRDMLLPTTQ